MVSSSGGASDVHSDSERGGDETVDDDHPTSRPVYSQTEVLELCRCRSLRHLRVIASLSFGAWRTLMESCKLLRVVEGSPCNSATEQSQLDAYAQTKGILFRFV